ncbi:hypothetical protein Tco_1500899 [Tanacetum coccineum]
MRKQNQKSKIDSSRLGRLIQMFDDADIQDPFDDEDHWSESIKLLLNARISLLLGQQNERHSTLARAKGCDIESHLVSNVDISLNILRALEIEIRERSSKMLFAWERLNIKQALGSGITQQYKVVEALNSQHAFLSSRYDGTPGDVLSSPGNAGRPV